MQNSNCLNFYTAKELTKLHVLLFIHVLFLEKIFENHIYQLAMTLSTRITVTHLFNTELVLISF